MSIDQQVLTVPQPAVWATDPGEALGPADSGGPSYAQVAAGWQVGTRPPARWMNWLQRNAGAMQRATLAGALSDWRVSSDPGIVGENAAVMAFHPSPGAGLPGIAVFDHDTIALSFDKGASWSSLTHAIGAAPPKNAIAIDTSNLIVGQGANIYFNNTLSTWTTSPTSEAHGMTGNVACLLTRYPSSTFAMAGSFSADIAYRSSGVGGAGGWVTASTAPRDVGSWDGNSIISLAFITGSTYLALTQGGQVWRSTNSGFSWALYATIDGGSSGPFNFMCRCPHTGAIVAATDDTSSTTAIWYSHDNGATWTEATFSDPLLSPLTGDWDYVKTAGGGAFVAVQKDTQSGYRAFWRSVDRGVTWTRFHLFPSAAPDRILVIGCDTERMVAVERNGTDNTNVWVCRTLDGTGAL